MCYSQSGPEEGETLPLEVARQVVRDAVQEGYGNLAISGGEPLLYRPLRQLLATAKELGMVNTESALRSTRPLPVLSA